MKKMFNTNNTVYEANETMTYCWKYPMGSKGKRVRISKVEFLAAEQQREMEREAERKAAMDRISAEQAAKNEYVEVTDEEIEDMIEAEAAKDIEAAMTVDPSVNGWDAMLEDEEPKKAKKRTRKSKDIAYEGHGVTLTAKQVDFIRHLPDTDFWENGLDSTPWTDVLADQIRGQFAGKPMTVGAMISTICEKGLAERAKEKVNNKTCTYMELTELGKLVAKDLGLAE